MQLQPITRTAIERIIQSANHQELLDCIEYAFVSYSNQLAVVPPVGTLTFEQPPADVHIKYGYIQQEAHFVIKIASGFYDNPALGLSSSNGLNLVFSQKTGKLETILLDEGYLTDVRTAVAGAVVAKHLAPKGIKSIGIMGTGIQARMQLQYLQSVTDCREVINWGRDGVKLDAYRADMETAGFSVTSTDDPEVVAKHCQLIVTTTASKNGIISSGGLQPGTLITAMGADTEGKQELHLDVLQRADLIVLDSTSQCQAHGEIHKAFQQGLLTEKPMIELGQLIGDANFERSPDDVIVADLTGIATQDIQISKFTLAQL